MSRTDSTEPPPYSVTFTADLSKPAFDPNGRLTLTFTVDPDDKWTAAPLTDLMAKKFEVTVTTKSRRVFAGEAGKEARKARVQERRRARDLEEKAAGVFAAVDIGVDEI